MHFFTKIFIILIQHLDDSFSSIYFNQNKFFVVSDQQTNADSAIQICSASGGALADVSNSTLKQKLIKFLVEKLVSSGGIKNL